MVNDDIIILKDMTTTRRQAREWAIQMLTAADLNPPEDVNAFVENYWDQMTTLENEDGGTGGERARGKLKVFAEERVKGVIENLETIDKSIAELLSEEWTLDRLGTVERAVLRMGIWEIKSTDIPKAVVINEAIDLANWFSSPKSRTLINGILDRYAKAK